MHKTATTSALVALAALAVLFTSCSDGEGGSSGPATAGSSSPTATATPSETATPTQQQEPMATVEQYASIVAQNQGGLLDAVKSHDECLAGRAPALACGLNGLTLEMTANTVATSLRAAQKGDAPGYIGQPPVEIADLVQDTMDDATEVYRAMTKVNAQDQCKTEYSAGKCLVLWMVVETRADSLTNTLKGWKPYL